MASFAEPDAGLPQDPLHGALAHDVYYKKCAFINKGYGADMKETWFGKDKPELLASNSCMNLPT